MLGQGSLSKYLNGERHAMEPEIINRTIEYLDDVFSEAELSKWRERLHVARAVAVHQKAARDINAKVPLDHAIKIDVEAVRRAYADNPALWGLTTVQLLIQAKQWIFDVLGGEELNRPVSGLQRPIAAPYKAASQYQKPATPIMDEIEASFRAGIEKPRAQEATPSQSSPRNEAPGRDEPRVIPATVKPTLPQITEGLLEALAENIPEHQRDNWYQQFYAVIGPDTDFGTPTVKLIIWLLSDPQFGLIRFADMISAESRQTIQSIVAQYKIMLRNDWATTQAAEQQLTLLHMRALSAANDTQARYGAESPRGAAAMAVAWLAKARRHLNKSIANTEMDITLAITNVIGAAHNQREAEAMQRAIEKVFLHLLSEAPQRHQ